MSIIFILLKYFQVLNLYVLFFLNASILILHLIEIYINLEKEETISNIINKDFQIKDSIIFLDGKKNKI